MTRLTPTGRLFLAVSVLLYLASLTSQSGLLLLLIGILGGCFLVNFLSARRNVRRLSGVLPPPRAIAEGETLSDPWKLVHPGGYQPGFIEIRAGRDPIVRTANLVAGGAASLIPNLSFLRRGVYPLNHLTLSSVYPFGLIRAEQPLSTQGEVVVHPALYPTDPPPAAAYEVMVGGKHRRGRLSITGTDFAGIRPAQPGDPLKSIHWRSSAKGLGLMTKTFEEELSGRIAILLDAGTAPAKETADHAIRAAGSLMAPCSTRGTPARRNARRMCVASPGRSE